MPKPADGDGPWGEAIRYWLKKRGNLRVADLLRIIQHQNQGLPAADQRAGDKNTVGNAARGLDCTTKTLRAIARGLGVPLDQVLVSPERQAQNDYLKEMTAEITEEVIMRMRDRGVPIESLRRRAGTLEQLPPSLTREAAIALKRALRKKVESRRPTKKQRGPRKGSGRS